ncbi:hypothetical protein VB773_17695 [Haloarculaceae archaeon H-GB2-1]|nr:hypothetical protein [Haloarculaceae archaeon H-GB1-1]MEA5409221.1 hypothetical protein [Haloarculaceae archaeon H-GB2-1]
MATNVRNVGLGLLLLVASGAVLMGTGVTQGDTSVPLLVGAGIASLGMAAGSLLIGTSESGRPV